MNSNESFQFMVINWYGENCFKIQTGGLTILTDPFGSDTGLTPPRFKADITLFTNTKYPFPYDETRIPGVVAGPGEYEIKGIEILGASLNAIAGGKNYNGIPTGYVVHAEDMALGFLGHLAHLPDPLFLETFGRVDILFVPAGAPYITPEDAEKLIKQIAPKIVVPSLFKIPNLKRSAEDVKVFLKELGYNAESQEKLTIKKKELPQTTRAVVLTV